jgi:hypothetical protein
MYGNSNVLKSIEIDIMVNYFKDLDIVPVITERIQGLSSYSYRNGYYVPQDEYKEKIYLVYDWNDTEVFLVESEGKIIEKRRMPLPEIMEYI